MKSYHQTYENKKYLIDDHAKSNSTSEDLTSELI